VGWWLLDGMLDPLRRFTAALLFGGFSSAVGALGLLLILLAGPLHERLRRTVTSNVAAAWSLEGVLAGQDRPTFGGWAIEPDGAVELARIVSRGRPSTVLELGPGASTELLQGLLDRHARLVALEHDDRFLGHLRERLLPSAVPGIELRHAPLREIRVGDWSGPWYAIEEVEDLFEIELLIVDGPPGPGSRWARYPAVPLLIERLAPGATVFVDDTGRPDERAVVEAWVARHGLELVKLGPNHTVLRVPGAR
jgi:hypothetical protein